MTQVVIHKTIGKLDQQVSMIGSDVENALPTNITAMDLIGLTWIFKKDQDIFEEFK